MQTHYNTVQILRRQLISIVCFVSLVFSAGVANALTEPGTQISNQAWLTYVDAETGESVELVSNIVSVVVSPLYKVSVQSQSAISVAAGRFGYLPVQIGNVGNVEDAYRLALQTDDLEIVSIVRDINGNGVADFGEPELAQPILLQPSESIDVVVTTLMSPDALPGDSFNVSVSVSSENSDISDVSAATGSAVSTISVDSGIKLRLSKSSSAGCEVPLFNGDELSHDIEITNEGKTANSGAQLLLDSERVSGFVVEHELPESLEFSQIKTVTQSRGLPVVRMSGVAGNSWVSENRWDGTSDLSSVGMLYPDGTFLPDTTDRFTILTTVVEPVNGNSVLSTGATADTNGDRSANFESNYTCHQLSVPAAADASLARLKFIEPAPSVRNSGGVANFNLNTDFVSASQYTLSTSGSAGYHAESEGVYMELSLSDSLELSSNLKYDRNDQRFIEVKLESSVTGDHLVVLLLETSTPGLFRSIVPVTLSDNQRGEGAYCPYQPDAHTVLMPQYQQQNAACVLASGSADQLQATYLDTGLGFAIAEASLVNPRALVFNAQTGLPVANAIITFRVAATDLPVQDRVTGLPYQVTTGLDGYYVMPRLEPFNKYYVDVEPPDRHVFPSAVPASALPAFSVSSASYGKNGFGNSADGTFTFEIGDDVTPLDIPLDSNVTDALLMVEKNALVGEIEVGGVVSYNVIVKNLDSTELSSAVVIDRPPFGYRYAPMSSVLDSNIIADPEVSESGALRFPVGTLEPGQTSLLTYSLRVTAAALDSNGVNEALATAVTPDNAQVSSPVARAQTRVNQQGVLSDRAALFGKIYVDQNCNSIHDAAEWPIGGVRLYLQDGTYTVSDADGSYSLYGLQPGTHVLKVDGHTLPAGLTLKPLDSAQAADPDSRFIDLLPGDFFRADFAAACPESHVDKVFNEIRARNAMVNDSWLLRAAESYRTDETLPEQDPLQRVQSADGDLSSGVMHGPLTEEDGSAASSISPDVLRKIAVLQEPAVEPLPDPKQLVSEITAEQAKAGTWVWPVNDLSTRGRFMAIVRDGIEPTLYINNSAVPASHIGERLTNRREKAQIVAWYGVELNAGENLVEVKGIGPFGNERILAAGTFKKPTSGASIQLSAETDTVAADGGRSALPVTIRILDESGYPALGVYFVTLESSDGGWLEEDIQEAEPGVQVRVSNGERLVHFVSSSTTGDVQLRARSGQFVDDLVVQQVSESRPLVASGLIGAQASLSDTHFGEIKPTRPLDLFDQASVSTRAAMFAKGRIKDRFNLTFSYDSDKNSDTPLMRDINPSAHYPIHGDASIRGFDAQSRSKLYVKVEEDKNSVMWGDFLTDSDADHEDLARSRRTLTGFNSIIDSEYGRFRFFASRQEDNRLQEEFPGNGSAMLYRLETYPIVANSEVVELVTRSRENPGVVIARTRLSRFGDYTIDPVLGFVTFASVIPTLDDRQNPVSVQISYDVQANGSHYWVTGLRYDQSFNDHIKLGFSHTIDDHSEQGVNRSGVYVTLKAGDNTQIKVSAAGSTTVEGARGSARQVSVEHRWSGDSRTSFTYARADEDFSNSGASIAAGRIEARFNHKQSITHRTSVSVDALQSESLITEDSRTSLGAQVESRLRKWLVRAGLRQVSQQTQSRSDDYLTAIFGVNRQLTLGEKSGQVSAEIEQDTGSASRRRIQLGGKLQVHEHARVYSNYELSNSLLALAGVSNDQKTEVLTMGVESDLLPQTRLYSEYRMRGAFDSRDYETASGIRADLELKPDLKVSPSLEIINSESQTDSFAASVAVSDTRNVNSRRLLRLETRHTGIGSYVGFKASYAARLNEDWTSVVTENLTRQNNDTGEDTLRHSLVAGFSRRPKRNNRHHMLLMYNWKEENNVTSGLRRSVHLLSTHQNLQLSNSAVLSGRLGGKHQKNRWQDQTSADFTVLAGVRLNFDIDRRINVDLHGGILATDGLSQVKYSAGAGVYYLLNKNARIGVGYNFGGFADDDLDAEEYHAHGLRFGIQFKFDEDSLKWLH